VTTLATIDVGTNTTLLLVARASAAAAAQSPAPIEVLAERAEITRLGRGIGSTGRLGQDGVRATLEVLRDYSTIARSYGARIAAIGTEALRRAPNADQFLRPAAEILGVPVEVIDGAREAALTFRAVIESFPATAGGDAPLVVIDIGGGSTEVIVARRGRITLRTSLPLGSVRLTERHVTGDPPRDNQVSAARAEIAAALDAVPLPAGGGATLIGVAGTVTSLAAMALDLPSYDPARVHGFWLARGELDRQIARLIRSTQAECEAMVGLDPRRADVILAGALILSELTARAAADAILVSDRGVRWGLFYEQLS
jgi:exopolyphosphatase/guanosine-5'-triphosphate,3'-diphosphate pyrophosphatase